MESSSIVSAPVSSCKNRSKGPVSSTPALSGSLGAKSSLSSTSWTIHSRCSGVIPAAYKPATMLPMLAPTRRSTGIPSSSKAFKRPMWLNPRAAPPPNTTPTVGRASAPWLTTKTSKRATARLPKEEIDLLSTAPPLQVLRLDAATARSRADRLPGLSLESTPPAGATLPAHKPRVYRTNSWRNPLLRGELNLPPLIALLEILLCTYLLHVFEGFKGVYDGFPGERIATVPLLPVPPAEKLHRPEDAQRLF